MDELELRVHPDILNFADCPAIEHLVDQHAVDIERYLARVYEGPTNPAYWSRFGILFANLISRDAPVRALFHGRLNAEQLCTLIESENSTSVTPESYEECMNEVATIAVEPKEFQQLDSVNYPSVMWYNGAYCEFSCHVCGANSRLVRDPDGRPTGRWFNGMRG